MHRVAFKRKDLPSVHIYFKSHCPAFFWLVRFNTKFVVSRACRYSYVCRPRVHIPARATLGVSFSTRLIPATHHRIAHLNIPRSPTALPPSLPFLPRSSVRFHFLLCPAPAKPNRVEIPPPCTSSHRLTPNYSHPIRLFHEKCFSEYQLSLSFSDTNSFYS